MKIPPAARNIFLGTLALAIFYFVSLVLFIKFAKFEDCSEEILEQSTSADNYYHVMVESKICRVGEINVRNVIKIWISSEQQKKKFPVFEGELKNINQNQNINNEIKTSWSGERMLKVIYSKQIQPSLTLTSINDLKIGFAPFSLQNPVSILDK